MDNNQGMGSHNEPFFELLQPTTPPITTGSSSSSYVQNGPRRTDSATYTFNNDDVLPNYEFQQLRTSNGSTSGARIEEAGSSKYRPPSYEVRDPPVTYEKYESSRPRHDFDKDAYDSATAATVERIMKKYADNLLRVLEGIGGRLSQLEATTQRLETSLEKVKTSSANNHGEIDGRLRMLENMVREVQRGVQVLRDKQEINEAHMQLKLQQEKLDVPTTKTEVQPPQTAPQQPAAVQPVVIPQQPQQPIQQPPPPPPPPPPPQQPHTVDVPHPVPVPVLQQHHAPPPPVHSVHPPPQQAVPVQVQQQQQPASYSYPPQNPLPVQAPPPPPPAPHHQQPPPYGHQPEAPPYPQPPPHHAQGPRPQSPPAPGPHHQAPHHPSQGYGVELYNPGYGAPPPPHRPHQHGPPPPMYEPPLQGRTGSGPLALPPPPPPPYVQQQPPAYETGYGSGSPGGKYRIPSGGGGGGYPHLPTAQPIQPMQQGRPPSRSGVDDVIDKVVTMGFPRDQVRSTVQRLTENGQPVDMNVVLDKLMNGAPEPGPPKGWFAR